MSVLAAQDITELVNDHELVRDWPDGVEWQDERVQAASVDLSVGQIVKPDGTLVLDGAYNLPPGGMAVVLTREVLKLPADVAALSCAPNFISMDGVLILNPGHIDPGYEGPITARLINFRRADYPVIVGEPIVTVLFERLTRATDRPYKRRRTASEYSRDLQHRALKTMSGTIDEFFADSIEKRLSKDFLTKESLWLAFAKYVWVILVALLGLDKIRGLTQSAATTLPAPWAWWREAIVWVVLAVSAGVAAKWMIECTVLWVASIVRRMRRQ